MSPAALAIEAGVRARDVEVCLEIGPGEVCAVLGANGAGKSTLLGLAAGSVRPDSGTVRVGGSLVAGPGVWVPPHRRRLALMAQEPLLFPHLGVIDNVAFGLRAQGRSRRVANHQAREILDLVGAADLIGRGATALSGGQAQRVALARALAIDPDLLLLDEPLAALDVGVAFAMRNVLRSTLREAGRSALVVTHNVLDVLALASKVVVLEQGRVVEHGPVMDVLHRPRAAFVAQLQGVNLLFGEAQEDGLSLPTGDELAGLRTEGCRPGSPAAARFSPRSVSVHRQPPGGSPRNCLPVRVVTVEQRGELVRVAGDVGHGVQVQADITPSAVVELGLVVGQDVYFAAKAAEIDVYPA